MLQTHPFFFIAQLRATLKVSTRLIIYFVPLMIRICCVCDTISSQPSQAKPNRAKWRRERVELKKKIEPWTTKTTFSSFENNNFIKNLFLLWNSYKFILLDTFWGFKAFFMHKYVCLFRFENIKPIEKWYGVFLFCSLQTDRHLSILFTSYVILLNQKKSRSGSIDFFLSICYYYYYFTRNLEISWTILNLTYVEYL